MRREAGSQIATCGVQGQVHAPSSSKGHAEHAEAYRPGVSPTGVPHSKQSMLRSLVVHAVGNSQQAKQAGAPPGLSGLTGLWQTCQRSRWLPAAWSMRSKTRLQSLQECPLCVADGYHLQGKWLTSSGIIWPLHCMNLTHEVLVRDALSSHKVWGISLADKSG